MKQNFEKYIPKPQYGLGLEYMVSNAIGIKLYA
jgi:hypothetical protein